VRPRRDGDVEPEARIGRYLPAADTRNKSAASEETTAAPDTTDDHEFDFRAFVARQEAVGRDRWRRRRPAADEPRDDLPVESDERSGPAGPDLDDRRAGDDDEPRPRLRYGASRVGRR
jgi:hypothetical protein